MKKKLSDTLKVSDSYVHNLSCQYIYPISLHILSLLHRVRIRASIKKRILVSLP